MKRKIKIFFFLASFVFLVASFASVGKGKYDKTLTYENVSFSSLERSYFFQKLDADQLIVLDTSAMSKKHLSHLIKMDPSVVDIIAKSKRVKIFVGDAFIGQIVQDYKLNIDWSVMHLEGWPPQYASNPRKVFDEMLGCYFYPDKNQYIVFLGNDDLTGGASTALHEVGHLYDYLLDRVSQSKSFIVQYTNYVNQYGDQLLDYELVEHHKTPDRAYEEFFAEEFAKKYMGAGGFDFMSSDKVAVK